MVQKFLKVLLVAIMVTVMAIGTINKVNAEENSEWEYTMSDYENDLNEDNNSHWQVIDSKIPVTLTETLENGTIKEYDGKMFYITTFARVDNFGKTEIYIEPHGAFCEYNNTKNVYAGRCSGIPTLYGKLKIGYETRNIIFASYKSKDYDFSNFDYDEIIIAEQDADEDTFYYDYYFYVNNFYETTISIELTQIYIKEDNTIYLKEDTTCNIVYGKSFMIWDTRYYVDEFDDYTNDKYYISKTYYPNNTNNYSIQFLIDDNEKKDVEIKTSYNTSYPCTVEGYITVKYNNNVYKVLCRTTSTGRIEVYGSNFRTYLKNGCKIIIYSSAGTKYIYDIPALALPN